MNAVIEYCDNESISSNNSFENDDDKGSLQKVRIILARGFYS